MNADKKLMLESQEKPASTNSLRHSKFISYLVLAILLIVTFFLWDYTRKSMIHLSQARFDSEAKKIKILIKDRIQFHLGKRPAWAA